MKNRQNLLSIIVVMFVILGILASIVVGVKVFNTAIHMIGISSEIRSVEKTARISPSGWSEAAVNHYHSLQEKRAEFTNSDDSVVKWFSNLNAVIKFLVIAFVVATWGAAILLIHSYLSYEYKHYTKRRKRRSRSK